MLARKEEVRTLVEEDEDGMIHSLLSSLPPLIDENEPASKGASASPDLSLDSLHLQPDEISVPPSSPSLSTPMDSTEISINATIVAEPELDSTVVADTETHQKLCSSLSASDLTLVDSFPTESFGMKGDIDEHTRPAKQSPVPLPDGPLDNSDPSQAEAAVGANVNGETTSTNLPQEAIEPDTQDKCGAIDRLATPTKTNLIDSSSKESLSSHAQPSTSTAKPVAPTSTGSPILSLSSLLAHASHLQTLFPPNHPSLHLSEIMGPQSVVHTWSENFRDWPSNDEAEKMVSRMDLIVYPFTPDAENEDDSGDQSEMDETVVKETRWEKGDSQGGKRKRNKLMKFSRHRRKPSSEKSNHHRYKRNLGVSVVSFASRLLGHRVGKRVEKKTILAGAVVVLGVAVAMYGVKSGRGGGGSVAEL